jgi:hypothetical protein
MRASIRFVIVLMVISIVCPRARAWNATGHALVAMIAYDELPEARRAELVKILRQHPRFAEDFAAHVPAEVKGTEGEAKWTFGNAAVWPDIARGLPPEAKRKYHRAKWHYVNKDVMLNGQATGRAVVTDPAAASDPAEMNVAQALTFNRAIVMNAGATGADRAVALCWVLHLMGDIHQPLHSATLISKRFPVPEGDRGGNSILVTADDGYANNPNFTPDSELLGPATNVVPAAGGAPRFRPELHAFWDNLMGYSEEPLVLGALEKNLKALHPRESFARELRVVEPGELVEENYRWARAAVYTKYVLRVVGLMEPTGENPGLAFTPVPLRAPYFKDARTVAEMRIALAGYRLADRLK